MDTELEANDENMAVIFFANLLSMYGKMLAEKRKRILAERKLRLAEARPTRYCLHSYKCTVYQAVLTHNDNLIKKHLRVTWNALHQLAELIPEKHHGWNKIFEVCVFLFWLACGTSYRVAAEAFTMSRYTVRDIVHKMLNELVRLLPRIVKYPSSETYAQIGEGFNRRAKTSIFTNAVGAIDGTYVNIAVPPSLHSQYINRKLNTSIQLQVVCGSGGRFYSICTGWPGSVHDQRVLRNSQLYKEHVFPRSGYYLLGDNGYACSLTPIAIITPFKRTRPLTISEKRFNTVHSKARSMVESAIGKLKQRWRLIFNRKLELKIENCIKVTAAACVMHNICLNDGLDFTEIDDFREDEAGDVSDGEHIGNTTSDDDQAIQFRNSLMERLQQRPN